MVLRIVHVYVCVLNSSFRSENKRMRMYLFQLGWYDGQLLALMPTCACVYDMWHVCSESQP